jgi:hypothetical protein
VTTPPTARATNGHSPVTLTGHKPDETVAAMMFALGALAAGADDQFVAFFASNLLAALNDTEVIGAIRNEPGNLCLRETAWAAPL